MHSLLLQLHAGILTRGYRRQMKLGPLLVQEGGYTQAACIHTSYTIHHWQVFHDVCTYSLHDCSLVNRNIEILSAHLHTKFNHVQCFFYLLMY